MTSKVRMATLGAVIRRRRLELGLTQEELAERVGPTVTQSDISRLEHGGVKLPRRERLEDIATALGLSLGDLLAHSGWMTRGDGLATALAETARQADALAQRAAIAPDQVAALADTVREVEGLVVEASLALARPRAPGNGPARAQPGAEHARRDPHAGWGN